MEKSRSAEIRARLNHPIIDSDGHTVEFLPAFLDVLKEVGGSKVVDNYVNGGGLQRSLRWYQLSEKERLARRITRPAWWGVAMKNTLDRATASMPKLLHQRLDEFASTSACFTRLSVWVRRISRMKRCAVRPAGPLTNITR
jgi:hypothetical protein